jgi:hypothetical protein
VNTTYFNTGLYTISEASRLTGVSRGRIRRWLRGYHYRSRQKSYTSRPLWRGQWEPIDHTLALGFLDLIEIRFVDAFRRVGVSWATLRRANERARKCLVVHIHSARIVSLRMDERFLSNSMNRQVRQVC